MTQSSPVVVAISSHVARGSVGNRAMVFALERLGFTVWSVPTILLPHHPGHGPAERIVAADGAFDTLLEQLIGGAGAGDVAAIVSGYLASPAQAQAVARLIAAVKAARPDALYLCDPVIGDGDRLYVAAELAEAVRDRLLPLADVATPNAFECRWLTAAPQEPSRSPEELAGLARRLSPPVVLVTSAPSLMRGQAGNLLVSRDETILFEHPLLPSEMKGSGDLFAALLLAQRLRGNAWPKAVELALSSVFEVVAGSVKAGADELMLAELQSAFVTPRAPIAARRLAHGRPGSP